MKIALLKRQLKAGLSETWYCKFRCRGRQYLRNTGSPDRQTALKRAKILARQVDEENWAFVEASKYRATSARLEQVGEVYLAQSSETRDYVARGNLRALYLIAREMFGEDPAKRLVSDLTTGRLEAWMAGRQGRDKLDRARVWPANAGINSTVRNARAVFARKMLPAYEAAGLRLGDLSGFLAVRLLKASDPAFRPLSNETVQAILGAAKAKEATQTSLYLCTHMMLRMGLRASEVVAARRHWVQQTPAGPVLAIVNRPGEYTVKRSEGTVPIPADLEAYFLGAEDYVIEATTPTARRNLVYKTHARWLQQWIGPEYRLPNHTLRKQAGCIVAMRENSYEAAASFLRDDIATAKKHYLAQLRPIAAVAAADVVGMQT